MNEWPGLEAYNAALTMPDTSLLAPGLKGATVKLNPWGTPNALSGGFAFIYELGLPGGGRKALRLFHTGDPGRSAMMKASYRDVDALRQSSQPLGKHLVSARWEDSCIMAGGRQVPGVVMDWVDAPTLGSWLERNHADSGAITDLRHQLAGLQDALAGARMVHGDIQTGNMAVRSDGTIVLLDYDGFRRSDDPGAVWESGHVHFRHPASGAPQALADRFPLLAMDLGLASIALEPSLFDRWSTGENVLFTGEDYLEPGSSAALDAAGTLPGMERAIEFFRAVCRGPAEMVPTLSEFHAAVGMATAEKATAAAATVPDRGSAAETFRTKARGQYQGQYPVLDPARYQGLAEYVGSKVELVGLVVSVKESYTKYGKPYAFVNFGDWRSSGTKLIWWSEGLEAAGDKAPDEDWEGEWISAVGLVDEPYANKRFGTVQYSITITDSSQVRRIDRREAERRLGTIAGTGGNVRHPASPSSSTFRPTSASTAAKPSNDELLRRLSAQSAPVSAPHHPAHRGSTSPTYKVPANSVSTGEKTGGCLPAFVVVVIVALFLYFSML